MEFNTRAYRSHNGSEYELVTLIPENEGDEVVIHNIIAFKEENGTINETFVEITQPFLNRRYGGPRLSAWNYEPEYEGIDWPKEFVVKILKRN